VPTFATIDILPAAQKTEYSLCQPERLPLALDRPTFRRVS